MKRIIIDLREEEFEELKRLSNKKYYVEVVSILRELQNKGKLRILQEED